MTLQQIGRLLLLASLAGLSSSLTVEAASNPQKSIGIPSAAGEAGGIHPTPDATAAWVQLNTGEWLKGRIRMMSYGILDFQSPSMGVQKIHTQDIKQLYSPTEMKISLAGGRTVVGRVSVAGQILVIQGEDGETRVPLDDVLIMMVAHMTELEHWHLKITAGLMWQTGNNPMTVYLGYADLYRQDVRTRFHVGYFGTYGNALGNLTADTEKVWASFDYFLNAHFFLRPAWAIYLHNPFQNIDDKLLVGAGVGVELFRLPFLRWDLIVGGGYQFTDFDSVEPGVDRSPSSAVGGLITTFTVIPFPRIRNTLKYDVAISNTRSGLASWIGLAEVGFSVTSALETAVSVTWNHIQSPTARADGVVPKSDDLQLIYTLQVDW